MAAFTKYEHFVEDLAHGVHDLKTGTSHVLKVALTNAAPNVGTHAVRGDITELGTAFGYTSGGISVGTLTGAQSGGTFKLVGGTDPVWTASGGAIGPFQYAVLYNDTPTSPADPLIAYWNRGSALTLSDGDSFTLDLDQVGGLFTLA